MGGYRERARGLGRAGDGRAKAPAGPRCHAALQTAPAPGSPSALDGQRFLFLTLLISSKCGNVEARVGKIQRVSL